MSCNLHALKLSHEFLHGLYIFREKNQKIEDIKKNIRDAIIVSIMEILSKFIIVQIF